MFNLKKIDFLLWFYLYKQLIALIPIFFISKHPERKWRKKTKGTYVSVCVREIPIRKNLCAKSNCIWLDIKLT